MIKAGADVDALDDRPDSPLLQAWAIGTLDILTNEFGLDRVFLRPDC